MGTVQKVGTVEHRKVLRLRFQKVLKKLCQELDTDLDQMSYIESTDNGGSPKSTVVNVSQQRTRRAAVSATAGHHQSIVSVKHRTSSPREDLRSAKKSLRKSLESQDKARGFQNVSAEIYRSCHPRLKN